MATEDARYRQSTQYRLWSFSPAQLADLRCRTNVLAKASISERISSSTKPSPPTSGGNTPQPENGHAANDSNNIGTQQLPDFLTPAEEELILNHYTVELLRAAKFIDQPSDVQATCAVFLRRFYVTNSIMTYPPTEMLKTALFFGAKAEGSYLKLSQFADKFPNTTADQILAGEFLLCQGIRFSFDVRHPFRGLEGAIMELRRYGDVDDRRIADAHHRAREILKFSALVTDVYFHFTPSQVMLGALSLADRGLVERIIRETFHHGAAEDGESGASTPVDGNGKGQGKNYKNGSLNRERINGAEIRDKVLGTIESCRDMLATEPPERFKEFWGTPGSNNIIKPLLRKLRKCRDPDRWNLVALMQAKKEGSIKKAGDRNAALKMDGDVFGSDKPASSAGRNAKRRKVSKATDDPFGPPLKG